MHAQPHKPTHPQITCGYAGWIGAYSGGLVQADPQHRGVQLRLRLPPRGAGPDGDEVPPGAGWRWTSDPPNLLGGFTAQATAKNEELNPHQFPRHQVPMLIELNPLPIRIQIGGV